MEERYVISVKVCYSDGREEWRYAGIDGGNMGSGCPIWLDSDSDRFCSIFRDIESAKSWFDEAESFLFHSYYSNCSFYTFDMKTLGIRKRIYKKVLSLSEIEEERGTNSKNIDKTDLTFFQWLNMSEFMCKREFKELPKYKQENYRTEFELYKKESTS